MAVAASARSLNIGLQRALNPPGGLRVERFSLTVGRADKVMQVANDYDREFHNGDFGIVLGIGMEEGELTAAFDGRDESFYAETKRDNPPYRA